MSFYLRVKHGDAALYWDGEMWVRRKDQAKRFERRDAAELEGAIVAGIAEEKDHAEGDELQPDQRARADWNEKGDEGVDFTLRGEGIKQD